MRYRLARATRELREVKSCRGSYQLPLQANLIIIFLLPLRPTGGAPVWAAAAVTEFDAEP